jgi:transcriptional regulator with GAF, ATPase, and Fis domain
MQSVLDLTHDLGALAALAGKPHAIGDLLSHALHAMAALISYDLAAVYTLEPDGDTLSVRAAQGPLADGPNGAKLRSHRLSLLKSPSIARALTQRQPTVFEAHDHTHEGDPYDGVLDLPAGHSCMVVPLHAGDRDLGMITFDRTVCAIYPEQSVALAGVYGQIVAMALVFAEQAALVDRYRHQLEAHNRLLRAETSPDDVVRSLEQSRAPAMQALVRLCRLVARAETPVLIQGETGVGKEVIAQAIHQWSGRADGPFIKLNCAAIPAEMVESELFGHVKGAFSGAVRDRPGRFRTANGGTLLLDEIGDMPAAAQSKLLRVLQSGTFEPLGSDRTVRVDVRVLAATHVDLQSAATLGEFREDLYYRLAVFPLQIPPLRARPEDALDIAQAHLHTRRGGPWTLSAAAQSALLSHPWPGNVRQLINALERATIITSAGEITPAALGLVSAGLARALEPPPRPAVASSAGVFETYAAHERSHLQAALDRAGGKVYGAGGAAALLGLKPTTLHSKLKKHGLR